MIELGFDFSISEKTSKILLKLKRNLSKINTPLLGYIWLVDKGDVYGNMHFHLVVAIKKMNIRGKKLPDELKLTFKSKKIHSSFVSNKPKWTC
jgi:hypothetical protein